MDYQIRTISREEMVIPIEWAAAEGWNPGLHDADSFYAADPQGFFMGLLDGEPISSISTVAYSPSFGFLGFYIVKPGYRGQGYGIQIWNQALKHLPTQNVGLDGVLAQQENYKKSGFKFAYRNIRFEGVGIKDIQPGTGVLPLAQITFEQLIAYDSRIFPAGRPAFIKPWIRQPDSLAVGVVESGKLQGYGVARKCRKGYKVGPLFADDGEAAEAIFQNLLGYAGEGVPVFLDVPEINPGALSIAERYAMRPMFETARMYTKAQPDAPYDKVYGVTTFELG
jgi:hypothetical protein